jgi:hypothetical protein
MLHGRCTALRSRAQAVQGLVWHKSSYHYAFDAAIDAGNVAEVDVGLRGAPTPTGSHAVLIYRH